MENPSIVGIYKITNPNGKVYIGQSINILYRMRRYSYCNCKHQPKLYNSLKKYGWSEHQFEIIEECSIEQLNEREIYWGNFYNTLEKSGLNLRLGNGLGIVSNEFRAKVSKGNLGKNKSIQHRNNISKARQGMIFTQDHKDNMSKSRKKYTVLCIQNNKIYPSANQASKDLNIPPCAVMNICRKKCNQYKGYSFMFI